MCFSSPKTPEPTPMPNISQTPSPTPSAARPSSSSALTAAERRETIARTTRYGLMSTIKTSGRGLVGEGPQLATAEAGAGKKKLGE